MQSNSFDFLRLGYMKEKRSLSKLVRRLNLTLAGHFFAYRTIGVFSDLTGLTIGNMNALAIARNADFPRLVIAVPCVAFRFRFHFPIPPSEPAEDSHFHGLTFLRFAQITSK